jgi:hypothetical protein
MPRICAPAGKHCTPTLGVDFIVDQWQRLMLIVEGCAMAVIFM